MLILLDYSIQLETTILMVVLMLHLFLLKFPKFWGDFGAGDDFLGVDLVESIDKGSIFGLETTTNRWSATRAFQITTHRLDTTTVREDISLSVIASLFILQNTTSALCKTVVSLRLIFWCEVRSRLHAWRYVTATVKK